MTPEGTTGRLVMSLSAALAAGVVVAVATTSTTASAAESVSAEGGVIGFYSNPVPGRFALWAMNADGTHLHRVISRLNGADGHSLSPNGRLVAYARRKGLYRMRPDGTRKRRIVNRELPDGEIASWFSSPAWSPDGRKLAFAVGCESAAEPSGIYVANADGSSLRALIPCGITGVVFGVGEPSWLSMNSIAFYALHDGAPEIWVMRTDVSGHRRILDWNGRGEFSWSPDRKRIAYDIDDPAVWIVDKDGSSKRKLVDGCDEPQWARSGDTILVNCAIGRQKGAFTIGPDGTGLRYVGTGHQPREGNYFWLAWP